MRQYTNKYPMANHCIHPISEFLFVVQVLHAGYIILPDTDAVMMLSYRYSVAAG